MCNASSKTLFGRSLIPVYVTSNPRCSMCHFTPQCLTALRKTMLTTLFKTRTTNVRPSLNSLCPKRLHSTGANDSQKKNIRSTVYYLSSLGVLTVGLSYAAVPLYKMFCQVCTLLLVTYKVLMNFNSVKFWDFLRRLVTAELSAIVSKIPK